MLRSATKLFNRELVEHLRANFFRLANVIFFTGATDIVKAHSPSISFIFMLV
jgi:hypothetical protein